MSCYRERQAYVHAARIALDRRVEEIANLREFHHAVEFPIDLFAAHADDGAVEIDVLASGQFRMKTGTDLKETAHPAAQVDSAFGRRRDATEHFEKRRL